jgi:hypothetical protein
MATTDIDICSRALTRLGESPISSFDDGSDAATICSNNYAPLKEFILEAHNWYAARVRKKLTKSSDTPANEWRYQYPMPSDLLALRAVYDTAATGSPAPYKRWELMGGFIQTDADPIWIEYTTEITEGDMPAYMTELLVVALAAEIAMAVTDQANSADRWARAAWGSSGAKGDNGGMFRRAKRLDRIQQPTRVVQDYTLVSVRG